MSPERNAPAALGYGKRSNATEKLYDKPEKEKCDGWDFNNLNKEKYREQSNNLGSRKIQNIRP
jgi:hypothetical protein